MSYFLYTTPVGNNGLAIGIAKTKTGTARVQRHLDHADNPAEREDEPPTLGRTLHYELKTNDRREAQAILETVRDAVGDKAQEMGRLAPHLDMLFGFYNPKDRVAFNFKLQAILKRQASYQKQGT